MVFEFWPRMFKYEDTGQDKTRSHLILHQFFPFWPIPVEAWQEVTTKQTCRHGNVLHLFLLLCTIDVYIIPVKLCQMNISTASHPYYIVITCIYILHDTLSSMLAEIVNRNWSSIQWLMDRSLVHVVLCGKIYRLRSPCTLWNQVLRVQCIWTVQWSPI